MKLRLMPARMGLTWMGHGLRACIRQPLGFIGLWGLWTCVSIFTVQLFGMLGLPALGMLLAVSSMPLVWMGFMLASRRVVAGQRVTPGVLLEPWRGQPKQVKWMWAKLGGAYLAALVLVILLASVFGPDSDALAAAMSSAKDSVVLMDNPDVQAFILWVFALALPVSLVFWHTPALIYWSGLPLRKALFFSAVASWRNLGAFILFGIGWVVVAAALVLADRLLTAMLNEAMLVNVLTTVGAMWVSSAFYASLYFSVVDCFEPDEAFGSLKPEVLPPPA